jgi:uncharacterized protein (TIGR03083 family)
MLPTSADRAATVDTVSLYEALRREVVGLVVEASAEEQVRRVAATPAWRVRDVLAHLAAIPYDLNRQDFGQGDPEAWTEAQVERHRDDPVEAIAAAWDAEMPVFAEGLRLFGYPIGAHYVGDLHAHLQDVRSTLGLPPHDDPGTVRVALDFYLDSLDEHLRAGPVGSLVVVAGDEVHEVGAGEPRATLTAPAFEVLRALSGRRSLTQIRAMDWEGEVDALAPRLSRYPLPEADLPA